MEKLTSHSASIRDYRDLNVWKDAVEVAVDVYGATANFPKAEAFGLTSQMRRAATSIPANIAEGYGRGQRKVLVQYLRIAQGSLKELETHTLISQRVGFMQEDEAGAFGTRFEKLGKMLVMFIRSLEQGRELN